jgi:nucleoside-diphosphate-sugar epimerase
MPTWLGYRRIVGADQNGDVAGRSIDNARGTVLLTGARGLIGRAAAARLSRDGWRVRAFDLVDGDDLRDLDAVREAAAGCCFVVHAGAIPNDAKGGPAEILATNVLGTWHVLLAAGHEQVQRVVVFSSVQVFGCSNGEGAPDYLPVDDDHPRRAARPYGSSKRLGEDLCADWTARTGIPTVVLRPVLTLDEQQFARVHPARLEHGAFVHVDDVADAVARALSVPVDGHVRLTLSAAGAFDATAARQVLGWEPARLRSRRRQLRGLLGR